MSKANAENKNRLAYIDVDKAWLITLVVLGHSLQASVADFDHNLLVKAIYSHHMAAFFFLSGLVADRPGLRFTGILRRVAHLLIPFFGLWLVSWLQGGAHDFFASFAAFIQHPDWGLWFLFVLSGCQLIFYPLGALARHLRLPEAVGIMAGAGALMLVELATGWNLYGFHFLAWYNLFFVAGWLASRYGQDLIGRLAGARAALPAVGLLVIWLVMVPCWQRNTPIFLPGLGELPSILAFAYRFVAAICGLVGGLLLCRRLHSAPRWVTFLGRQTMGIYVTHGIYLSIFASLCVSLPICLRVVVLFIAGMAASLFTTILVRRIPVVGRWIL